MTDRSPWSPPGPGGSPPRPGQARRVELLAGVAAVGAVGVALLGLRALDRTDPEPAREDPAPTTLVPADGDALRAAVVDGDAAAVDELLAAGVDPDSATGDGASSLHLLAGLDGESPAELFGSDAADRAGRLDESLRVRMATSLLAAGADVDATDANGAAPLAGAADGDDLLLVDLLLAHGADVDARDAAGDTALLRAATRPGSLAVAHLLGAGADPGIANDRGHTPLLRAVATGDVAVVDVLLAAGAPPDMPAQVNGLELVYGMLLGGEAGDGGLDRIEALGPVLGFDDLPFDEEEIGVFTPLYLAVARGDEVVARRLLDAGADPVVPAQPSGHLPAEAADLLGMPDLAAELRG